MEIKSIKKSKEDLFIRCGNRIFKPTTIFANENSAVFISNPKEIEEICKDEPHSLLHFHGFSFGYHSMRDKYTHERMFNETYATDGDVVGIDGIHIQTYLGHNIKIPWSDKFYEELSKHGVNVIHNVNSVFCTRINDKYRECIIRINDGLPPIKNIFNKVDFEEPSLETAYYPYRTLDKNSSERVSNIDYHGKKTICLIATQKGERHLKCFQK